MSKEIERKFLVKKEFWKLFQNGKLYRQGYLFSDVEKVVRIRIVEDQGFLTVKSKLTGFTRDEFEYEIPYKDAENIINNLCLKPLIEKYRSKFTINNLIWEIDKFIGQNDGLVIAELELADEKQSFELPEWVDKEVTLDNRYYNSNLVKNPFCNWKK